MAGEKRTATFSSGVARSKRTLALFMWEVSRLAQMLQIRARMKVNLREADSFLRPNASSAFFSASDGSLGHRSLKGAQRGGAPRRCLLLRGLLGTAIVSLVAACTDAPGEGTPGELGDGTFDYVCANSGDLKCSDTYAVDEFELGADMGRGDALPVAVAVGATFGIRFSGWAGASGGVLMVDAVSSKDRRGPNVYRIEQPAEAAIIATDNEGKVVDFTVVTALEAAELSIWHEQDERKRIVLDVGETIALTVAPRSEGGTFLAGALPYKWRISDPEIAAIGELGEEVEEQEVRNEGDIEVAAVSAGTTTLRVRSGDLQATVTLEVRP